MSPSTPKPGGAKVKRRLQIHPVEAETVRLIFELYVSGHASTATPALGIKEVAKWLNRHGYRTKRGGSFGVGPVPRNPDQRGLRG